MRTGRLPLAEITALAEQTLAAMDLCLWGIELMPAGKRTILRVYVDLGPKRRTAPNEEIDAGTPEGPPPGVLLDELAEASRRLSVTLDAEDMVPGAYVLELSSPGLDRIFFRLEQIAPYLGREIEVLLTEPCLDPEFAGRKRFSGRLQALEGDRLELFVDNREVDLRWNEIKKARLAPRFPETGDAAGAGGNSSRRAGSRPSGAKRIRS